MTHHIKACHYSCILVIFGCLDILLFERAVCKISVKSLRLTWVDLCVILAPSACAHVQISLVQVSFDFQFQMCVPACTGEAAQRRP